jgi:hypothetical protein
VGPVQLNLAVKLVRKEPGTVVEYRGGTLIAGGFNGQHPHITDSIAVAPVRAQALRALPALETVLVAKGLIDPAALDALVAR